MINKLKQIKAVLMDVDGVLTDGSILINSDGSEIKKFDVQDGLGISAVLRAGLLIFFISSRKSKAVFQRARELNITGIYQGSLPKNQVARIIMKRFHLVPRELAFIGDDLVDLPVMKNVGFPVAVANAREEVKQIAGYVTHREGGHGAIREVVERILSAQGKWSVIVDDYRNPEKKNKCRNGDLFLFHQKNKTPF